MASGDSEVQVNAAGSGAKIATHTVDRQTDVDASGNAGTPETVHQQLVTTADKHGDTIADDGGSILAELRKITEQLELLNMKLN